MNVQQAIASWQVQPFARHQSDCCAFVNHVLVELRGTDLLPEYHDDDSALDILQALGGLRGAVTHYMKAEPVESNRLAPGDVALIQIKDYQGIGIVMDAERVACVFEHSGLREVRRNFIECGWPI